MLEDLLSQVHKPGRYIGREWNISAKDFSASNIKFALCFPDLYEVGMSNLGLRILYGILNNIEDVCCERVFAPAQDMEQVLRNNQEAIFSLESGKGLSDFDLIGFSLGYELNYTNVLNMLELGGIPLKASDRNHAYPLVIGGGPCALNPEPMHEFFDLFFLGEAEEAIVEIMDIYRMHKEKFKAGRIDKKDLLTALAQVQGVYVPGLYQVEYGPLGKVEDFRPAVSGIPLKIRKRFVADLDSAYFPCDWLVPYIQIIHDRITLEVMRGCPNKCSFCQARSQYYPFRQRESRNILNLASRAYQSSGYEEISLVGLSVSDYAGIEGLLTSLVGLFKEKGVSVSLPSIKPRTMVGNLSALIASIKKTGLTFAPEAASERLRRVLNKDFQLPDFFKALEQAYASGYQHVKLYFMIGLPSEAESDLDAILEFGRDISDLRRKIKQRPAQVNISINTLIPKPHTPFQWLRMEDLASIKQKQDYLRKRIKCRSLRLNFHDPRMSFLEGVFSRGDRRLSRVVLEAFRNGARFDAWGNYFVFEKWTEAFAACGINPDLYLEARTREETLPWDFLDVGVSKERLARESSELFSCCDKV